jgi:hypothetical protein
MSVDDAAYYVDVITRLLATKNYDWCRETLEGIAHTVEQTGHLTPRQKQAVDRIIAGRLKHDVH